MYIHLCAYSRMRIYCEVYAQLYVVNAVLAMVYVRHASHLQARERNGGHFVYSKLIVKRHATYSSYSPLSLERLEGIYC